MVTFKTRKDGRVFPIDATRGSRNTGSPPRELSERQKQEIPRERLLARTEGAKLREARRQPLPPNVRNFLSSKISKNIKEGKPRDQAIAIAFSQTRKKFPEQSARLKLPTSSSHIDQPRLRSLLISLLGLAIALRVLREIRT